MYPKYFGLKEPSFSIAPDPHYLFLSEQHKEALAHLLYGAGERGGFVLLTGEVGTGKTTVCRAFLEQLPAGVDVALILNPAQTAVELLNNICDELRIEVPAGERSIKVLVDRLNQYLLESHGNGRRPVLIIDEAQNLRPQVMEQIRLLTNLETTKDKLLQIFLIGQPELRRMLESERLRQLNQRITARFHLTPFNLRETSEYIRHRVAVAGVDRPLFTAKAIRLVYRHSGGIPRLINILCDRALLGACVTRSVQVTPAIVAKAAREVQGDPIDAKPRPVVRPAFVAAGLLVAVLAGAWWSQPWWGAETDRFLTGPQVGRQESPADDPSHEPVEDPEPPELASPATPLPDAAVLTSKASPTEPDSAPEPLVPTDEMATTEADAAIQDAAAQEDATIQTTETPTLEVPRIAAASLQGATLNATLDRLALPESAALLLLLRRWGLELDDLGRGDPCVRIVRFGLACTWERGKLSNVRFFDLPALLRVRNRERSRRFLVLSALGEKEAVLDLPTGSERLSVAGLERIWTGGYLLVWQPPPGGSSFIGAGSSGEDVRWLRGLLSQVPDFEVVSSDSSRFDTSMARALRAFQSARGLVPDGVAGPRTLIQLHHAVEMPGIPRLSEGSMIAETLMEAP